MLFRLSVRDDAKCFVMNFAMDFASQTVGWHQYRDRDLPSAPELIGAKGSQQRHLDLKKDEVSSDSDS
jgi:hypothetical protein